MSLSYTHKNIAEVINAAPALGFSDWQESRFATDDFDAEQTGFSHHTFKPGKRQGFGHHIEVLVFAMRHARDPGEIIQGLVEGGIAPRPRSLSTLQVGACLANE